MFKVVCIWLSAKSGVRQAKAKLWRLVVALSAKQGVECNHNLHLNMHFSLVQGCRRVLQLLETLPPERPQKRIFICIILQLLNAQRFS